MRILVLGGSSRVGTALAEVFATGNDLILTGRNVGKLTLAVDRCRAAGAAQVGYVEQDLSRGVGALLEAIGGKSVDLVIDAASASSNRRDAEIEPGEMAALVSADFLARTAIIDHLRVSQDAAPAVIFISTVLTFVKSPGRTIYSALKALYETYLAKIRASRPDFRLLIVYVGTVIDIRRDTPKSGKLASAIFRAFNAKRDTLFFGLGGRVFVALFHLQPVLFHAAALTRRRIREWLG